MAQLLLPGYRGAIASTTVELAVQDPITISSGLINVSGGGLTLLAFPSIAGEATTIVTGGTVHSFDLPDGIEITDGVIVLVVIGSSTAVPSVPSGWEEIPEFSINHAGVYRQHGYRRVANSQWPLTQPTSGSTETFNYSNTTRAEYWCARIERHSMSSRSLTVVGQPQLTAQPVPPALMTDTGVSESVLVLEAFGADQGNAVADYESPGYTKRASIVGLDSSLFVASKQFSGIIETPGPMQYGAVEETGALTMFVYPGSEGFEGAPGTPPEFDALIGPSDDIQTALNALGAGGRLGLQDGTYYQSYTLTGGRRIGAVNPGNVTMDAGSATLNAGTWSGSGSTWTRNLGFDPGMIVVGRMCLFNITSTGLTRGYSYSSGTVTLRTGGVNPNNEQVTICQRDYCISVTSATYDQAKPAVTGLKFRGFRRITIGRTGATPGSSTSPAAPNNFVVEDCDFLGTWKGVDWGRETGSGNVVRYCSFSCYPIFRDSTRNAADSGSPSENTQWGTVYNSNFVAGGLSGGDRNLSSFRFGGSGDKFHNNICFNLFDGAQPRQGSSTTTMSEQEIFYNAFINCRDDEECDSFNSTLLHRFRWHHNFHLCCYVYMALSVVARGPAHVDRNIFVDVPESWADGLSRGTFWKFRSDETSRNNFVFHNTIRGAPKPSHGLFFQPPLSGVNCHDLNNIWSFSDGSSVALPSSFTHSSNLTGATPGFTSTSPYNFTPLPATSAASGGNTSFTTSEFNGLLQSHRGALAVGEVWPMRSEHVGPRWATRIMHDLMTEMLADGGLPSVIDPLDLGITV